MGVRGGLTAQLLAALCTLGITSSTWAGASIERGSEGEVDAESRVWAFQVILLSTQLADGESTQENASGIELDVRLDDVGCVPFIDGLNRRVGKKVDGVLVQGFLYQDNLNPVAELDGAGNVVGRFAYGVMNNVPNVITKSGVAHRVVTDHLGSPRFVVNLSTGAVVSELGYDAWGVVQPGALDEGWQPFGFAGGIDDRDVEFVRFGARDYAPAVGRWASKDSSRFSGELPNLYSYVSNDPVGMVDVDGRLGKIAALLIILGPSVSLEDDEQGADVLGAAGSATGAGAVRPRQLERLPPSHAVELHGPRLEKRYRASRISFRPVRVLGSFALLMPNWRRAQQDDFGEQRVWKKSMSMHRPASGLFAM